VALTRWSLPRLADHLTEVGVVQISPAHLGRVLADAGLSFQRTRTWKASPDPDYEPKAERILELRAAPPPNGGHVIAFDQMGPISLRPTAGAGLGAQRTTRASARDLPAPATDPLRVRRRRCPRRPAPRVRQPRLHGPDPRPDPRPPMDLLDPGLPVGQPDPDIRRFAAANRIELVPTPTYASYLNPVECHFFPIQEFVVNNADYLDWDAFAWALARHVQNRNPPPRQAHPHPRSPSPDRRLMPFPVKRCEKGH
jgi:hypothetical protein